MKDLEKNNLEMFQSITEEESTTINGGFGTLITVLSYIDSKWDDWKANFKSGQASYNNKYK